MHSEPGCSVARPKDYSVTLRSRSNGNLMASSPGGQQSILSGSLGTEVTNVVEGPYIESPISPRLSISSNNLYDHEDPWHTIGVILGLSPSSQDMTKTLVHDVADAISTSYIPKSLQGDQENIGICLRSSSLSGDSPPSKFTLSTYSSSWCGSLSTLGRSDACHDEKPLPRVLTSPGHSFSYEWPAQHSSLMGLVWRTGRILKKP